MDWVVDGAGLDYIAGLDIIENRDRLQSRCNRTRWIVYIWGLLVLYYIHRFALGLLSGLYIPPRELEEVWGLGWE